MPSARLSPPPHPSRRRTKRFSRSQLEHNLQILKTAVAAQLLPPTLPPTPPTSRSTSPVPLPSSSKRKLPLDASASNDQPKRPRTSIQHSDVHQQDHPRSAPPPVKETLHPVASTSSALPPPVLATAPTPGGPEPAASFPHRRGKPSAADFTRFHERYSLHGKAFKYSAEIRNQAAGIAQDHQVQRKLNPAPLPGTPYAIHAQLFSRIEAVDALLNFTYAMWCKDMVEGKCHHSLWDTIDQFLKWVRGRWETSETRGDAQCAFIGVIRMVEAYIYARKASFLNTVNAKRFGEIDKLVKPPTASDSASSISPATSLGGSSQHSVPTASPPSGSNVSPIATPAPSRPLTSAANPNANTAPHPAHGPTVAIPKDLYDSLHASHNCNTRSVRAMSGAALYLNLPVLARCFPHTNARLHAGQLRLDEEFEVDFEQDECGRQNGVAGVGLGGDPSPGPGEGQLVWPGPLSSLGGEGVAWVCLLGRAMIREMAYPLGYRGLEGLLRKEAPTR